MHGSLCSVGSAKFSQSPRVNTTATCTKTVVCARTTGTCCGGRWAIALLSQAFSSAEKHGDLSQRLGLRRARLRLT